MQAGAEAERDWVTGLGSAEGPRGPGLDQCSGADDDDDFASMADEDEVEEVRETAGGGNRVTRG